MAVRAQLYFGAVPVPYTVSWSDEQAVHLARCPHAGAIAMCNPVARGVGKPKFGAPHMQRQRETIARCLCDLCGRPLAARTKVSLSQARPVAHAARFGDVLQVEPLLHRECARISMQHCPSLQRQARDGSLMIRQVFQHRVQFAIYSEEGVFAACGVRQKAICYAKVQLVKYADRPAEWLEAANV